MNSQRNCGCPSFGCPQSYHTSFCSMKNGSHPRHQGMNSVTNFGQTKDFFGNQINNISGGYTNLRPHGVGPMMNSGAMGPPAWIPGGPPNRHPQEMGPGFLGPPRPTGPWGPSIGNQNNNTMPNGGGPNIPPRAPPYFPTPPISTGPPGWQPHWGPQNPGNVSSSRITDVQNPPVFQKSTSILQAII